MQLEGYVYMFIIIFIITWFPNQTFKYSIECRTRTVDIKVLAWIDYNKEKWRTYNV